MKKYLKRVFCFVFASIFAVLIVGSAGAVEPSSNINRFNVFVVLDASNSMNYTDPKGLRYEAIGQFFDLLAERGNFLGGVVFSNDVEATYPLGEITGKEEKKAVISLLRSVMSSGVTSDMGYTNIGAALTAAIDQLESGANSNLPPVILFLSDGNTEMPSNDALKTSLDQKADAIERARTSGIPIYSICLNSNHRADAGEMEQISSATGGVFQEVENAGDLIDVFNTFYNLIYGTSTITLADDVFPESGILETQFEVPGIGVEEVNIVINGKVNSINLNAPDGTDGGAVISSSETYTLVKTSQIVPGTWSLITTGVPGDRIKINMVYNPNLGIDVKILPQNDIEPNKPVQILATLQSGTTPASSVSQYQGYSAELKIKDVQHETIKTLPMTLGDDGFSVNSSFDVGTYFVEVHVTGNYLEKDSGDIGPLTVRMISGEQELPPENTAPTPVKDEIKKTVYIWPFKGGSLSLDMTELATDKEDKDLLYKLISSSFIEGKDYRIEGNTIVQEQFSLSKGSYDIRATDSEGLSCDIHVVVQTINVGILTCIILGLVALVVLAVIGFNVWYWSRKPFYGDLKVQSIVNGVSTGGIKKKSRGRCYLNVFGLEPVGLNYRKTYLQATGERWVWLITEIPVTVNGQQSKKTRIPSGVDVNVIIKQGDPKTLRVRFDSKIPLGKRKPVGGGRPPGRPTGRPKVTRRPVRNTNRPGGML